LGLGPPGGGGGWEEEDMMMIIHSGEMENLFSRNGIYIISPYRSLGYFSREDGIILLYLVVNNNSL